MTMINNISKQDLVDRRKMVLKAAGEALETKQVWEAVASYLGISVNAIGKWSGGVPHRHVLALSELTDIPEWEIRPDLYRAPGPGNDAPEPDVEAA